MALRLKLAVLVAIVLLFTGCAGSLRPETNLAHRTCDAGFRLSQAEPLLLDSDKPLVRDVDAISAQCRMGAAGVASVYQPFRLPAFKQAYHVTIESQTEGEALFAPEVLMLDAQGKVVRTIPYERFNARGDVMRATVFVNAENGDERYLVVGSASSVVGGTDTRYVSGMFVVPLLAVGTPFLGMQGTESRETRTLAYNGRLSLLAESANRSWKDRRKVAPTVICCAM